MRTCVLAIDFVAIGEVVSRMENDALQSLVPLSHTRCDAMRFDADK